MKKVLIVLPHMLCGGVEKSLLSLLEYMPRDKYDITVRLVYKEGRLLNAFPKDIDVNKLDIPDELGEEVVHHITTKQAIKKAIKKKNFCKLLQIAYKKIIFKDYFAKYSFDIQKLRKMDKEFDLAICYHIHCPFIIRYIAEKVSAKMKIAWIHNDFSSTGFKVEEFRDYLSHYQAYMCVSEQLKEEFGTIFPEFIDKILIFRNIVSKNQIKLLAKSNGVKEFQGVTETKILSIGRLNDQKGFDMAISVCRLLVDSGYKIKWYILGDGDFKNKLTQLISNNGLENIFILLGERENPYPYIDGCDIYVQPSRHEGYGIAVAEARMLSKPIICTDFAGAREQLINYHTGLIVPISIEAIFNACRELLDSNELQKKFSKNLAEEDEDTKIIKQIKLIERLMEE